MRYNYKGKEIEILNKDWNCRIKAEGREINDVMIDYHVGLLNKPLEQLTDKEITETIHEGIMYDIVDIMGQEYYDSIPEDIVLKVE